MGDALVAQRGNGGRVVTQLRKESVGVLAQERRPMADAAAGHRHRKRDARHGRSFGQAGIVERLQQVKRRNLGVIEHGQQVRTLYMERSETEVKEGDRVRKGERLGLSGATGRVTGPHLHLSARWQGQWMDPVLLLHLPLPTR